MKHTSRKPLNQAEYKMLIIQDLGTIHKPGMKSPKRYAIFACTVCAKHIERDVQNAKKSLYCTECAKESQQKAITKPLIQSEFQMTIIEDLGMTTASDSSTNIARYAIFECTECKAHFKARATGTTAKSQTKCITCASENKRMHTHPLYPIWNGIKQRCYSPLRKDYHNYGGKGVTMAPEWIDDPVAFITWCTSNGWAKGLEIDKDIKCRELGISPAVYAPHTISFVSSSINTREACGRKIDQLTLDGVYLRSFNSAIEAAEFVGALSGDSITSTCRNRQKTSYGYKWCYSNNV
jgi:hypothetical protein